MVSPSPVIIDGNLHLHAVGNAVLGERDPNTLIFGSKNKDLNMRGRGLIVKTFIGVIFHHISEIDTKHKNITHVGVVWDKSDGGKYCKTLILDKIDPSNSYKGDRNYANESDLSNPDLTREEILKIKKALIIQNEINCAREILKEELPKLGIPSIQFKGWEADDIDYIWGLETNKLGGTHIHFSGDSDWSSHITTSKDIHYQVNRSKVYIKTEVTVREKNSIPDNLSIREWAELDGSVRGTHNNLLRTLKDEIKVYSKKKKEKVYSGDYSDIGYSERFNAQRETFQIEDFPNVDKIRDMYGNFLKGLYPKDLDAISSFCIRLSINPKDSNSLKSKFSKIVSGIRLNRINLALNENS